MAATPQRYLIQGYGQAQPTLIVSAGDGPTTIVNNDELNTVYFDNNIGVNPTRSTTVFLPPQASTSVDGKEDVYATCVSGQTADFLTFPGIVPWQNPVGVQIALNALGLAKESTQLLVEGNTSNTVTVLGAPAQDVSVNAPAYGPPTHTDIVGTLVPAVNAPSYGPATHTDVITTGPANITGGKKLSDVNTTLGAPAQDPTLSALATSIPNNISTTGAPPIILSTATINTGTQVITAGNTYTNPLKTINQPGYEIFIDVKCAAASTTPWVGVIMQWLDSVTGQVVAIEHWYLTGGSATFQNFTGTGPTKGNQLQLLVINGDAANSTSISVIMLQNSRTYVRDDWRNETYGNIPNFTAGTSDGPGNVLFATFSAVSANGTVTRVMPLYAGIVQAIFLTQTGAAQFAIFSTPQATMTGLAASQVYLSNSVAANSFINTQLVLPRGQCMMEFINGATAQSLSLMLIISEQAI